MKKALYLLAILAPVLMAQNPMLRQVGSLGPATSASGLSITATAGSGGVTAKLLAAKDAGNPTAYVLPGSGGCGSGIAASTVSAAATFEMYVVPGVVITGVADNTVTAGHILVGGTTTPGRVKDSGQTSRTAVSSATCVVGVAQASASTAGDVLFRYDGAGTFGAGPVASGSTAMTTGALAANTCASATTVSATGVLTTDAISFTPNADISAAVGYGAGSAAGLKLYPFPTVDNVNFTVCNGTGTSITVPAMTINWAVRR